MNLIDDAISNPDPYYIKSVTEFSASRDVVTSADIYSSTGIKLVAKGTHIDSSFYDKLVRHKLTESPIDRSLSVKDAVTPEDIERDALALLDADTQLSLMADALPNSGVLHNTLAKIHLNDTLAFKLTLARETRPKLYRHSVRVALISLYLGARLKLDAESMITLATAAMFHDLGELHIDPALFEGDRQLEQKERQYIYVHPMIMYLILKEYPEYHPAASEAVLDHHERLDGSGYPRNLEGGSISALSQILAVAEVAGSLCGRVESDACAYVEVVLKLNSSQFRNDLVGFLAAIARQGNTGAAGDVEPDLASIRFGLQKIDRILAAWDAAYLPYRDTESPVYLSYIQTRLTSLRKGLFGAGFNLGGQDAMIQGIEADPVSLSELRLLVRETCWQINGVVYETRRRWPEIAQRAAAADMALNAWAEQVQTLLG
ncbi:MAG: HD domain-containing phosphohydrolase [Sulfuriferula sp.]|nr:HD domain-containing phosphohydrolase [Sulfuriferula sp.]